MAKPTVKICGLRTVGMIESMINLSVDYIGFVFAKSRRQVAPELAAEMIRTVRKAADPPRTVGVFADASLEELERIAGIAGLDAVQLHGGETPEFCLQVKRRLKADVFKVFSVPGGDAGQEAGQRLEPFARAIDGAFLDTYDPVLGGGTGKAFSWEAIPSYREAARRMGIPLIVAGGLNADNVGRLLRAYAPDGVDVSSGVETNGEKDIRKIRDFVERVRSHG